MRRISALCAVRGDLRAASCREACRCDPTLDQRPWYETLFAHYARRYDAEPFTRGTEGECAFIDAELGGRHALRILDVGCGTGRHAIRLAAMGYPVTGIDYEKEDFTVSGERYAVVFDAVGKSTFARCRPLLEPGGLYQSTELGPWGQNPLLALVTPPFGGRHVRFPIPRASVEKVRTLAALLAEGRFHPLIDRRYPLTDVREAFAHVASGRKVGHVLLDVAPVP
jgi:hypothetical protein